QHHNYRRLLHTQQRNRSERYPTGRFWKGVAQITRNRDWTFIASHCSKRLFSISSIWTADRRVGIAARRFSTTACRFHPESGREPDRPQPKIARKCATALLAKAIAASASNRAYTMSSSQPASSRRDESIARECQ